MASEGLHTAAAKHPGVLYPDSNAVENERLQVSLRSHGTTSSTNQTAQQ